MPTGVIESLDHEARGITRLDGKTIFVEGALPGERVEYVSFRRKPSFEVARTERILKASPDRVVPRCPHFGVCGGCSMQHLDPAAQVAAKQRILESNLWHLGRVRAEQLYSPIYGTAWSYRQRARLSARLVVKKGGVLVGFHERRSSFVADMRQCEILPQHVSSILLPLRELIAALSIRHAMPQIEVAVGESMTALVLRILVPIDAADEVLLRAFADRSSGDVHLAMSCGEIKAGEETLVRVHEAVCVLDFLDHGSRGHTYSCLLYTSPSPRD